MEPQQTQPPDLGVPAGDAAASDGDAASGSDGDASRSGGEVVPPAARRVLDRAPSERYAAAAAAARSTPVAGTLGGSMARASVGAIVPAAVGAALLVVLGSPLALVEPPVGVAGVLGLAAGLGTRWGGGTAVSRPTRRALAVSLAVVAVAVAEFTVWQLALAEGGVLPLPDYALQVFGPVAILQPLAAGIAAWGAA